MFVEYYLNVYERATYSTMAEVGKAARNAVILSPLTSTCCLLTPPPASNELSLFVAKGNIGAGMH
jgi:hypothetical protein